jgi:hypothetical protein
MYLSSAHFEHQRTLEDLTYIVQEVFNDPSSGSELEASNTIDASLWPSLRALPPMNVATRFMLSGTCIHIIDLAKETIPPPSNSGTMLAPPNLTVPMDILEFTPAALISFACSTSSILRWIEHSKTINMCWKHQIEQYSDTCTTQVLISAMSENTRDKPTLDFTHGKRHPVNRQYKVVLDICATHNVLNVETLTDLANYSNTQISLFEDNTYDRPRLAVNYPSDNSSTISTLRCRLFVAVPDCTNFHQMDFFVIPGAQNTISGRSLNGLTLFKELFLLSVPTTLNPRHTQDEDKVDYTNETDMSVTQSHTPPGSPPSNGQLQFSPFRFFPPLPESVELFCSPPLEHNLRNLTIWTKDNGYYYGTYVPFQFDNDTSTPVISSSYAEELNLQVHSTSTSITFYMGYSKLPYKARTFALLTISLPNQDKAQRVPCLVSDSRDLSFMLIPITLADKPTLQLYVDSFFKEPHSFLHNELHKYQSFCYAISSNATENIPETSFSVPPTADLRLHRRFIREQPSVTYNAHNPSPILPVQDLDNAYHYGPNPLLISARVRMQEMADAASPFHPTVHVLLPEDGTPRLMSAMCMDFSFDFNLSHGVCPIGLNHLAIRQYVQSTDSSGQLLQTQQILYLLRLHIDEWPTRLQAFPREPFLPGFFYVLCFPQAVHNIILPRSVTNIEPTVHTSGLIINPTIIDYISIDNSEFNSYAESFHTQRMQTPSAHSSVSMDESGDSCNEPSNHSISNGQESEDIDSDYDFDTGPDDPSESQRLRRIERNRLDKAHIDPVYPRSNRLGRRRDHFPTLPVYHDGSLSLLLHIPLPLDTETFSSTMAMSRFEETNTPRLPRRGESTVIFSSKLSYALCPRNFHERAITTFHAPLHWIPLYHDGIKQIYATVGLLLRIRVHNIPAEIRHEYQLGQGHLFYIIAYPVDIPTLTMPV